MIKKSIKFLFIQSEHENIGIEYLSANLKEAGHKVHLLFFPKPFDNVSVKFFKSNSKKENFLIKQKIKKIQPDIVAFSPFSSQYQWSIQKAKFIKNIFPQIFTLFGGVHINSVPNIVIKNNYVDGLIIGEADQTIVDFANNFKTKKLYKTKSLWIKKDNKIIKNIMSTLPTDLDALPFPDKQIFYDQIPKSLQKISYVIMASRGCPFSCTYCSNNVYNKLYTGQKRLRFRSPQNIIQELTKAKTKYNFDRVEFMDDVFAIDQDRLIKVLKLYQKHIHKPFSCFLHPQFVNENMIKLLKQSNCFWLKMGVQSANENYRKKYLNRLETNQDLIRIAKLCHKYHLNFSFDHIFNLPKETKLHLIEAVKLYNLCTPSIVNFGSLIYLPKTDIINYGLQENIINKKDVRNIEQGIDPVGQSSNVSRLIHQSKHNQKINISAFSLLFIFTSISPRLVDYLMKIKFYNIDKTIPNIVIIFFKIISKIKANQFYLYSSVIKSTVLYSLKNFHN